MAKSKARWIVEVHLVNGRVIEQHITSEEAEALVTSRSFIWRGGESGEQKQASAIFTVFSHRLDKGEGFVSVTDPDHKTWLLPVRAILAINIADVADGSSSIGLGFAPPIVEERKAGTGLPSPAIVGAKARR